MKRSIYIPILEKSIIILLFLGIFTGCATDFEPWEPTSNSQVITDYVNNATFDEKDDPDENLKYTLFSEMLELTSYGSLLSVRGPFTLFVPNDAAMTEFLASKNVSSVAELDLEYQKQVVLNHIINARVSTDEMIVGAIAQVNGLEDKLSIDQTGENFDVITINKSADIVKRNIEAANGYIHEINEVIEPITVSMYDQIAADPSFSIFTEGIDMSGLKDTLSMLTVPYGNKSIRTYFTLLAVPDTTFNRYGIYNVNDLIDSTTIDSGNLTDVNNGFYQYMEYHCLDGTYFLSDFSLTPTLYPILSFNNNVLVTVTDDYKLNHDRVTDTYTGFLLEHSNIPVKNGAIHVINDFLPVINPEPTKIIYDTTNYLDVKQGDFYKKYYQKWYDGKNTFAKVKWEGDYLQYYYKDHNAPVQLNFDCWQMFGFFWIEITLPKVMSGTYEMTGYLWAGRINYYVYVDGVKSASITTADPNRPPWGTFTWDTTEEHTVKIVNTTPGIMFWDTVELTPVIE